MKATFTFDVATIEELEQVLNMLQEHNIDIQHTYAAPEKNAVSEIKSQKKQTNVKPTQQRVNNGYVDISDKNSMADMFNNFNM